MWWCALTGRHRGRLLRAAVATLLAEDGLQERLEDPVPLFDLVLSSPAAKRAVEQEGMFSGVR